MSGPTAWERVGELGFDVHGLRLEAQRLRVSEHFERTTTCVRLTDGAGRVGVGEDVSWALSDHEALWPRATELGGDLRGTWSCASFSAHLDSLELFSTPPAGEAHRDYRRWAFESAALDLALGAAGCSLGEVLARPARPVDFVASLMLPRPPSLDPLQRMRARAPGLRFKLDVAADWDEDLVARLREHGAVAVCDLKGYYRGTPVDLDFDEALYRRLLEGMPEAIIEDPLWCDASRDLLAAHAQRIAMDAPIHSAADLWRMPYEPRWVNSKPSRFGRLERLFEFYEACAAAGVAIYGGGQFELGAGRRQIQELASLFHPVGPNDVAPVEYHAPAGGALASSPLPAPQAVPGFGRGWD